MRLAATFYRGHDPKWAWSPLSGEGAAIHGGRFNKKARPALYLGSDMIGVINEMNHGFTGRILPLTLCSYDIDCEPVADLTSEEGRAAHKVTIDDMACPWFLLAAAGATPPSWSLAERLEADGHCGLLAPSFAIGAQPHHHNLVLWKWGPDRPHSVSVHDPSGRLPKNSLSWD